MYDPTVHRREWFRLILGEGPASRQCWALTDLLQAVDQSVKREPPP